MRTIRACWEDLLRGAEDERLPLPARLGPRSFARWWRAIAEWPPDVFALTHVALEESGAYRLVVAPKGDSCWRPGTDWLPRLGDTAQRWWRWSLAKGRHRVAHGPASGRNRAAPMPARLRDLGQDIARCVGTTGDAPLLSDLASPELGPVLASLVELHATADEACWNFGVPTPAGDEDDDYEVYRQIAGALLYRTGKASVARVPPAVLRVLPKMRTPQTGMTMRALSHDLCAVRSEVDINWGHAASRLVSEEARRLNLLLVPWPLCIEPTAFKPSTSSLPHMDEARFGFFLFAPAFAPDVAGVSQFIGEALILARRKVGRIDGVVLPEAAIDAAEVEAIREVLQRSVAGGDEAPPFLLAGVRGERRNEALLTTYQRARWHEARQGKHHRWCIDETQVRNDHLGSALRPTKRWWEDIDLERRALEFACVNSWLTVCHLICEDLARQEPVAPVIRAVGPTLIIALLLDGPQLAGRWPGQYATVLADDPGSAVLTLSALGMVDRSRPPGLPASRVVGLWKDGPGAPRELALDAGSTALVLSLASTSVMEYSADGRNDGGRASRLLFSGLEQLRVPLAPVASAG